jgi:GT2 family glycosyltransferase
VIIPVYNHCSVTMRCLRSIAAAWSDTLKTEIIVVDDCSTDETSRTLAAIPGIIVLRNAENVGFIRSCNRAAAIATGRYLCFLNNDTVVRNDWLDHLVSHADSDPSIGVVGPKLIGPDGTLQEAGNIVWRDGTAWNYGRSDDPADPRFNFRREVDYCSGACLLVRTTLFRELGGFNEDLLPAYYEDADLCFALRERGNKVMYEPNSEVVHYEGVTSGTSTARGVKRYQDINRAKFYRRWQRVLAEHYESDPRNVYRAARRLGGRRTGLIGDAYVPLHDREAGSARILEIIKILRDADYRVIFQPDNWLGAEPYTTQIQALGVEVIHDVAPRLMRRGPTRKARTREALPSIDIAWVSRPNICERWLVTLRDHPHIRVLYDTVDLHHVRLRRQSELEGTAERHWKKIQAVELACAEAADATIVVTEEEKERLKEAGVRRIYVVPTIHNPKVNAPRDYAATKGLLFIGGYNHLPNVDAVVTLCRDIMPIVWQSLPELHVTLLGSNPPQKVLALRSQKVAVPGYVADVGEHFMSHRLFVAPIRYGAGIKGKIGHALSYGLPIVTTPIGAEGFALRDGLDFLRAETAGEFADAIVRLYSDPDLWTTIATNSLGAIEPFSTTHVAPRLCDVVESVCSDVSSPM